MTYFWLKSVSPEENTPTKKACLPMIQKLKHQHISNSSLMQFFLKIVQINNSITHVNESYWKGVILVCSHLKKDFCFMCLQNYDLFTHYFKCHFTSSSAGRLFTFHNVKNLSVSIHFHPLLYSSNLYKDIQI